MPFLDEEIDDGQGRKIIRRTAWAEMLAATRDWHRLNRRQYTNQSMINDLNGIYSPNRGLAVLVPAQALPEAEALRYLYESVGLEPWRNSDPGGRMFSVGKEYWQLTDKGLTKELGYVVYGQRATRDASALQAAALTRDPHLIGYAQQMVADNQFFASGLPRTSPP